MDLYLNLIKIYSKGTYEMKKVMINDQIIDKENACLNMFDRGYHFGDGVYEVIRVWDGELFTLNEHIARFYSGAAKIKIEIPFTKDELKTRIRELIKANNIQLGIVYFQLTRGVAPRKHEFPSKGTKPVFTAYTDEKERPEKEINDGVEVILKEDIRWLRCDIKSINLLPNVLAKQDAKSQGCFEAIFYRDGIVTEGSSTNVFIVKDGKVITHPASNLILNGITRQVVIKLTEENNITLIQQEFSINEMLSADEVFLTSVSNEVMPIIKVDGKIIGKGTPGSITRQLQTLFKERILHDIRNEKQK